MISVVGDVRIPGQFPISAPITLLEALAKAGWVTNDAGPEVLVTIPGRDQLEKIAIAQLLQNTDPSLNLRLAGGEVVNVPDAMKEIAARFPEGPKVWVAGNVGQPQVYSITSPADANVTKAVARVLGAVKYSKTAYIYRDDGSGQRREIAIPLNDIMHSKAQDVMLQADDVLLIPDDDSKKMQQYYETHPLTPPWEKTK
jgi:polysaccharide export outer membrane protein